MNTDIDIINQIKEGDLKAFRELYVRYSDLLYRNIFVRINNEFDADDILQGFFLQVWEKRASIHITTSVRGYLLLMLRNYILDCIRMEKIRQVYEEASFQEEIHDDTWEQIVGSDLQTHIQRIAETFPPRLQTIYKLRHEESYSIKEIADEMSLSEQTVKNQLGEIKKRFKLQFQNHSSILMLIGFYLRTMFFF